MKKLAKLIYDFVNDGGWRCILALGFFGIVIAIIAMYGKCGFNWIRFILFDLPLFSFCGWAIYNGVYKVIKNNKDIFYGRK